MRTVAAAVVLGLTAVFAWVVFSQFSGGGFGAVLALIGGLPATVWLVVVPLTALFYLLDQVRFRSLLGILGYPLSVANGARLTAVSYFVTSLTPAADLHTPAMVYMLFRRGVPVPHALAASVTKSIVMVLWICAAAYGALWLDDGVPLPDAVRLTLPVLTLPLLGLTALLVVIAFAPERAIGWADRLASRAPDSSLRRRIAAGVGTTARSFAAIGRSTDRQHLLCHVASVAFLFTYITVGFVLARAFGFPIGFGRAITVFSTSLMIAYLSPVPGSIGVTELTSSYMLDPALTPEGMAASLTLRILCWYLVTVPGGLVLAAEFRRSARGWSFATD